MQLGIPDSCFQEEKEHPPFQNLLSKIQEEELEKHDFRVLKRD